MLIDLHDAMKHFQSLYEKNLLTSICKLITGVCNLISLFFKLQIGNMLYHSCKIFLKTRITIILNSTELNL